MGTACARLTVTKAAKAATSFAITVNGGSSATITYGAKATLAESGLPAGATGSITFSSKSPSATLCTVSNYPTSTSCQTSSSLATGAYTGISASFSDTDGDYTGSTSTNTVSLTVDKATLTVTASSTSTSYGTVPTVTASYSGFQNGEGTGSLTKLPSCSSTVTATSTVGTYPGANTCSGGAATDYSFSYVAANATVTKDSTTAKVSLSPTTVTYGNESQSVFTVTVTTAHGERLPTTDSATVKVGSASCIASLAPSGSGTCTIPNTALAANPTAYTVTASYPGDSDLSASSQATATTGLTVTKDSTKTTVSLSPSTVAYGNESQAVFTTKVTTHYGEAVPNGDTIINNGQTGDAWEVNAAGQIVWFYQNPVTNNSILYQGDTPPADPAKITVNVGSASCTVTLPATTCTIPNTALAASGTAYAVSATFNGDTNLSTSTGKTCTGLTITKAAPVITSANSATAKVGSSFSFQVTASGYPAPSLTESGKLPTGVRFNSATGVLSGTAATGTAGTYTLTFTATNSAGSTTQSFTLTVSNSCY